MKYEDELAVVGGAVVSALLVMTNETEKGFALFSLVLGYVFGRTRKLNGELKEYLKNKK